MKIKTHSWATVISLGLILFLVNPADAEKPNIIINLEIVDPKKGDPKLCPFGNLPVPYFDRKETIIAEIGFKNESGESIIINKGFRKNNYQRNIFLINPAGRLVSKIPGEKILAGQHSPLSPLGYIKHEGKLERVAPCEKIYPKEEFRGMVENLTRSHDLSLPGVYGAKVQLSAMTFHKDFCGYDRYKWQGVFTSNVQYFFYEGQAEITINPSTWSESKMTASPNRIWVELRYDQNITRKSVDQRTIRLNSVKPSKIELGENSLHLFFNALESILSLNDVGHNKSYAVIVSGKLITGQPFGGARTVCLVP